MNREPLDTILLVTVAIFISIYSFLIGSEHGKNLQERRLSETTQQKIHEVNAKCRDKLIMYFNQNEE